MNDTAERTEKTYNEILEESGLEDKAGFPPFLDLTAKAGNWVIGTIGTGTEITFTPKKGKSKGKKVSKTVYRMKIKATNIEGVGAGDEVTLSPSALLAWQLEDGKPEGVIVPCEIAIRYRGRDSEERHQTSVAWPKQNS